ncbi:uncharacterized protein N7506_007957 [Penicillium brevicompactum]|uniref:uncharacterized protein n=1 Tax=Penicillium brevicompactum TaxID=5074 RepID=UPI00253FFD27|nr:uncharacterized protein N7506_007957 [Penicillium brevicompactum]KAJ5334174.1 hypothetical protein N7506_007957 [Penicillium brevicompactum]
MDNMYFQLMADRATLEASRWPPEIREEPTVLDDYYTRAETMLQPSIYPEEFQTLSKLEHLEKQSKCLGQAGNFRRAPLTTFFHRGRNNAGVQMEANRRTGHECTGLNDGSKNSVATTYLVDSWNWGAEIFCGCEVRFVEKTNEGGYIIHFAWHGSGRAIFGDHFKEQLFWVKSEHKSDRCLQKGYNDNARVNGIARRSSDPESVPGPTITGVIDNRETDATSSLSGYVIQDGCIPEAFKPIIHPMLLLQTLKTRAFSLVWNTRDGRGKFLASLRSVIFGPYAIGGAVQRTSTYLVMSHDSNEMTLTLKDNQICLSAPKEGQSKHFQRIKEMFHELFARTGAQMGFTYFYGRHQEEVTVHLLGGANMSSDGTGQSGVTNHVGEVLTSLGSEVHQGLVCCDASIIPTSLGVNPLATISALAERSVDLVAKKAGLWVDLETRNRRLETDSKPERPRESQHFQNNLKDNPNSLGWQFTEALSGHIHMGPRSKDYELSENMGKSSSCSMQMVLTIELCKQIGSGYQGICTGTVSCRALSKSTLRIAHGTIEFFSPMIERAETLAILYHLELVTVEGMTYHLEGSKPINSTMAFSVKKTWQATTTVNVSITRSDGTHVGMGAVHISLSDFKRQIKTFRTTQNFHIGLLFTLIAFLLSFSYCISIFFFRPFAPVDYPKIPVQKHTDHKTPRPAPYKIRASDGVIVHLDVYEPEPRVEQSDGPTCHPPILLLPGVTGMGAKHNLFALPFLRCNAVRYFTKLGHRCYALTPRWGCDLADARNSTVFDCRLDVAAALEEIRSRELQKPYVIAHCQGSVALCMGLLDGTIKSNQLLGISVNSVFMNQVFGYWNSLKREDYFVDSTV